jgi:hypothetical protein
MLILNCSGSIHQLKFPGGTAYSLPASEQISEKADIPREALARFEPETPLFVSITIRHFSDQST